MTLWLNGTGHLLATENSSKSAGKTETRIQRRRSKQMICIRPMCHSRRWSARCCETNRGNPLKVLTPHASSRAFEFQPKIARSHYMQQESSSRDPSRSTVWDKGTEQQDASPFRGYRCYARKSDVPANRKRAPWYRCLLGYSVEAGWTELLHLIPASCHVFPRKLKKGKLRNEEQAHVRSREVKGGR